MSRTTKQLALATAILLGGALPAFAQEVKWRHDYGAARKEASDKKLPILMDIGSLDCFWCRKLESVTFQDPGVIKILNDNFIPVKVQAERQAYLVTALQVQSYPTLVFATSDGQILNTHEGFADVGEFVHLARRAFVDAKPKTPAPAVVKTSPPAKETAAAKVKGQSTSTSVQPLDKGSDRVKLAKSLLARAKEDYQARHFLACLECCALLTAQFKDLPEGKEAMRMAAAIKSDPAGLDHLWETLTHFFGDYDSQLGASRLRKHQLQQATMEHLERMYQLSPRQEMSSQSRLLKAHEQPQNLLMRRVQ